MFRDRTRFPCSCNFQMTFAKKSINQDSKSAVDGVSDAEPTIRGFVDSASGNTVVSDMATTGRFADNFGVGCYIRLIDSISDAPQFHKIASFDNATSTFTLETTITGTPTTGANAWVLYGDIPIVYNALCTYTNNTVSLLSPSTSDIFTGNYFRLQTDNVGTRSYIIRSFDSVANTIDVHGLSGSDTSVRFEILKYNYDNESAIAYNGPVSNQTQRISYSIHLEDLTIPLAPIKSKRGGNIYDYPFVYVRFGNTDAMSRETLWTNNPSSKVRGSLFRVPIDSADENNTNFCTFKCEMEQVIKFKPADNMSFAIYLDDGTPLEFMDADTTSPAPPTPTLQVSALFSVTPLVKK